MQIEFVSPDAGLAPRTVLAIAVPALAQGTRTRPAPVPYVPGVTWEHRSPAAAGVDSAKLAEAIAFAVRSEARAPRDMEESHYRSFGREELNRDLLEGILEEAQATGLPAMRAMALAFPDDPASWAFDTQYMFGHALLIAPVFQPGGRVKIYLPHGLWYDFWTGESFQGGRVLDLVMPL
jgi:hypothetical protein